MRQTGSRSMCAMTPCETAFSACKSSACATARREGSNISGTASAVSLFVILVLTLCLLQVCGIPVAARIAAISAGIAAAVLVLAVRIRMCRFTVRSLKRDLPYSVPV